MKNNSYITLLLLLAIGLNANELGWVDKQIEAIKPAREGVSSSVIADLDDPFIFYKKKISKKVYKQKARYSASKTNNSTSTTYSGTNLSGFSLKAIMNKSALINGKWYKESEKIGRYNLSAINTTSVVLTRNGKKSLLYMSDKNNNLKFKR